MVKKLGFAASIAALLALIVLCQAGSRILKGGFALGEETLGSAYSAENGRLIVLDPGHGGMDGGKEGVNGAKEKDINLQISLIIKELLEEEGVEVVMTRDTEERIGEDQVSDLKARVDIMNKEKPVLAVSIHQSAVVLPQPVKGRGARRSYYSGDFAGDRPGEYKRGKSK